MHYIGIRVLLKRLGAIFYLLKDKSVPFRKKLLVVLGIAYILCPVDLIPPILFPFAVVDDLIVLTYILFHLAEELDTYWIGEKKEDFSKKFRDKTFVEGVEFNVEDDDKKDKE